MTKMPRYTMLIVGIVLIIVSAFVLVDANAKQVKCESLTGQIVQIFDVDKEAGCSGLWIIQLLAYIAIALGVALLAIGYLRLK